MVILTSDHGDMQGERGLWYKMSFFEGSARVPLVVSAPGRFAPARVSSPVSTMDLLPTLVGIAGGDDRSDELADLDAESLLPLLRGDHDDREVVVAEYLAEGAVAPSSCSGAAAGSWSTHPPTPTSSTTSPPTPSNATTGSPTPTRQTCWPTSGPRSRDGGTSTRIDTEVRTSQRRRHAVGRALGRGRADGLGLRPAVRRVPALHPQPHGPRCPRGRRPLPLGPRQRGPKPEP